MEISGATGSQGEGPDGGRPRLGGSGSGSGEPAVEGRAREAAVGRRLLHARLSLTELVADLLRSRPGTGPGLPRLAAERLWAPPRLAALDAAVRDMEPALAARHRTQERLAAASGALRRARQELAESQVGLVVLMARRHAGRGLALPDLIQEGHLGLMTAIDRFEPERGLRLSTYAQWWIRQVLGRALRTRADLVRSPLRDQFRRQAVSRAAQELGQELRRRPEDEEVACRARLDAADVRATRGLPRPDRMVSLSHGEREGLGPVSLPDPAAASPLEQAHRRQVRQVVSESFRHLRQRERAVVALRYGLLGCEAQTLEQIGRRMKLSRERVRQIEGQALRKLRRHARVAELGTGPLR